MNLLLALAAAARWSKPPQKWRAQAAVLLSDPWIARMVGDCLDRIKTAPLTATPPDRHGLATQPQRLFSDRNTVLARGMVWLCSATDGPWVPPVLSQVALRCASSFSDPGVTAALSGKVANAAIDVLAELRSPGARRELLLLSREITRNEIRKRVLALVTPK